MDYARILTALARPAAHLGVLPEVAALRPHFQIQIYDSLPSTNQMAWQQVEQGQGAGTVILARQQSAGRGQWGRHWVSARGGIYCSLVLAPDLPLSATPLLTLASAWGIATSFNRLGVPLQLKWPNDLVSQGRKVGGLLVESRLAGSPPRLHTAVVGVGLNWDNPVPEPGMQLRQVLPDPPPVGLKTLEEAVAIALRGLWQGYLYWQHQGSDALIRAYSQLLVNQGQTVMVAGHPGTVVGVTPDGSLMVRLICDGQQLVRAFQPGEICLGYNG